MNNDLITKDNIPSVGSKNESFNKPYISIYKKSNEEIFLEWKESKNQDFLLILLNKNRKFLFNKIRKFQLLYNSILEDEDLLSIASVGFIKGCEHFDYSKGAKLLNYISYWIYSELNREIQKHGFAVSLPAHIWNDFTKLNKILKNSDEYSIEDILSNTGLSLKKYNQLMEIQQNCLNIDYLEECRNEIEENLSLDSSINFNGVNIENSSEEEENTDNILLVSNITRAMSALSDKEKDIILKRLTLEDDDKMTLREIADKYGVSHQRVHEIETRALNKLRNTWILNSYKNVISSNSEYIEDYSFKKDNVSYIPSTQEIIHKIINLQSENYDIAKMYEQYLICSKLNGYKEFISIEKFREKFENYIQHYKHS